MIDTWLDLDYVRRCPGREDRPAHVRVAAWCLEGLAAMLRCIVSARSGSIVEAQVDGATGYEVLLCHSF